MEGVGLGALAAAAKHASVDMKAVIGGRWAAGEPVPFEFLADTFEAIAETSKRLDIVNLLVGIVWRLGHRVKEGPHINRPCGTALTNN